MKKVLALTLSLVVLASTFGVGVALSGDGSLADGVSYGDSSTAELNADASVLAQQGNGQGGSGAGGDGAGQGGPGAGTDAAGEGRGSGGSGSGGGDGGPPAESGPPDDHDDDDSEEEDALQPGPINTTGVIEEPGVYTLTEPIDGQGVVVTAFEIKSSDVVLDGAGFTVSDGTGEAIHILGTGAPLENVTIRDMTITRWESGISAMNVKNSSFEDLVIESNNDAGLVLQASSETAHNEIRNVVLRDNEKGVFLREKVEDTYIYGLTAEANHEVGLKVSGASYTHLEASTFVGHDGEKAIHFTGISPHNTLLSNVVHDSGLGVEAAIQIGGESGDNYLWNNTVSGNQEVGISLGPPDNVLEENVVFGNGGAGVVVEGAGAEFSDNEIYDNEIGVQLAGGATGATFDGDVVRSNEQWDVYAVEGVTGNAFSEVSLGATVVSIGESSVDFAVKGAADPGVTPPDDYQTIGKFVEAESTSADGMLDLRVHYEAPGDVDPSDQGDLIMGRLVGDAWEGVVGDNGVDAAENYVYATITEFSVFAPMYGTTDITPPVVEAGEDRTVLVNTSVAFSAEASDDSGEAVDVVWDFGDGESETGADVTHVFDSAGVFEVTATATDNASNEASDSLLVTVVGEDLEQPVVDAGEDRTVLNGTLVHFDATVSDDL
ncbi:MAG TPA: right-handed parallel beta-helix repeat-containing protein, partial [Halobacteriales archaeon]|nr:right-handed parallel beta-helix repeat-containing protein [Halobacteriales archaeon]